MKAVQIGRGSSVQNHSSELKSHSTFRELLIVQHGWHSSKTGMVGKQSQGDMSRDQVLRDFVCHTNLEFILMVMGFKQEEDMIKVGV